MIMNRFIFTLFCFLTFIPVLQSQIYIDNEGNIYDQRKSQNPTKQPLRQTERNKSTSGSSFDCSKLTFGGSFGMQFGDYTVINISPQVGYNFSKYFTLGAGLGYSYYKYDFYGKDKSHYASFDIFGRVYPIQYIVLSVQPEINRMWRTVEYDSGKNNFKENKFVPTVLIGGGLRFMGFMAMLQYDVVQDDNSPYGDRLFYSLGYSFSF